MESENSNLKTELNRIKLESTKETSAVDECKNSKYLDNYLTNEELKIHFQVKNWRNLNELVGDLLNNFDDYNLTDAEERFQRQIIFKNQQISQLCKLVDQLIFENNTVFYCLFLGNILWCIQTHKSKNKTN